MGEIIYDYAGIIRVQGTDGILEIIDEDCIECGLCVDECAHDALYLKEAGVEVGGVYTPKFNQLTFVPSWCTGCGDCVPACAVQALRSLNLGGGGGLSHNGEVFGDYGDGVSNPPTSTGSANGPGGPQDDCGGKSKAESKLSNPNNKAADNIIRSKLNPPGHEWGSNQKLNSLTAGDYKASTPSTIGSNNSWQPDFTWDSVNGYSTGYTHIHPDGTAPSPEDAFWLLKNLSSPQLSGASDYEIAFYKANASFTTISAGGNEYIVSVANWDLLQNIYNNRYLGHEAEFDNSYNKLADLYLQQHPGASEAEATEYAFKGKLGDSVNFYKKKWQPNSTGDNPDEVQPLKFEPITNPGITQLIRPINCF